MHDPDPFDTYWRRSLKVLAAPVLDDERPSGRALPAAHYSLIAFAACGVSGSISGAGGGACAVSQSRYPAHSLYAGSSGPITRDPSPIVPSSATARAGTRSRPSGRRCGSDALNMAMTLQEAPPCHIPG